MARILDRGRLVVAIARVEWPPFLTMTADGGVAGYDARLAQALASALGVRVEWDRSAGTADELIDRVARGDADIGLSRLSATLDRAKRVRFSRPYLTLRQALLVSRVRFIQSDGGRDPAEIVRDSDAAIAVRRGSGYEDYARFLLPRARLRLYSDWQPDIANAVLDGEVIAGYGDELAIKHVLAQRVDAPLRLRMTILPDAHDRIAIALPWNSIQLAAWIDLYLESTAQPTVDDLSAGELKPGPSR